MIPLSGMSHLTRQIFIPLSYEKLSRFANKNTGSELALNKPRKFKEKHGAFEANFTKCSFQCFSSCISYYTNVGPNTYFWGKHFTAKQRNYKYGCKKRNHFREKLARRRLNVLNRRPRSCWFKNGRTDLWWENMWNGIAPEECWKKNFRMPRESFMNLLAEINPYISPDPTSPNYRAQSAAKNWH